MNSTLESRIRDLLSLQRVPICEGWCTAEKAITLANLILENKLSNVVEVGVFGGRSLIPMAMAMQELGSGVVVGIDPWTLDAAIEGENGKENDDWWRSNVKLEDIYRGFIRDVMALELTRHCNWIRAKSDIAYCMIPDKSIQLFHQDSNHSELVSCREVFLWKKKLAAESFWILDDSDWPSQKKAIGMIGDAGFKVVANHDKYMIFKRA